MSDKVSATIEDYLNVMYVLERDGEPVTGTFLAEQLHVSAPTVTNTLKRMLRDNLITLDSAHGPHLTTHGGEVARTVMRRHMLAELLLSRMLPWAKVHKEAHEMEHAISDEVEAALLTDLNQPEICPHGNPLPGHEDAVAQWVPLTQIAVGEHGIVRRIHELAEDAPDVLDFLEKKNIGPGSEVVVAEVLPFNQTITVCVGAEQVALGFALARYLFVEKI